ncbi:MAG: hypothetical protein ACFCUE_10945 [Candidatus Bathyarchaeia archaeon]|jgi:hypothetical protein
MPDDFEVVSKKLEEIDNKLERIKSDTHNLNRITTISNASTIVKELSRVIGRSELKAAVLYLTKEEISAADLATGLGVLPANLTLYVKPFLGNKAYISEIKKGRNKYFQRSELVDLISFETIPEFAEMIASWKAKKEAGKNVEQ